MKTWCKPADVNIESVEQNRSAVINAFEGKLKRGDFRRFLIEASGRMVTEKDILTDQLEQSCARTIPAMDKVAEYLTDCIRNRDLNLKPIREFTREDGLTHKVRDLCQETPKQQVFEYIAVKALQPLFKAKILPIQYGSMPGGGQVPCKRKIERILRRKFGDKAVTVIKGDVRKAYPSVTTECVMELLRRDIRKNKPLLWFIEALMANYPGGHLCIGSYLSAWLFNYVMSYVLRYLSSQCMIRRGKRNRLVLGMVCYADDFAIFGRFGQLSRALRSTMRWVKQRLHLEIKPVWQIYPIASFDSEKAAKEKRKAGSHKRTPGVDMVGYAIRKTYTIIRGRVFLKIRKQLLRAYADLKEHGFIPWWRAVKIMAYNGWIKNSDSITLQTNYNVSIIKRAARHSVSRHGREEHIINEQRILQRIAIAC